MRVVYGVKAVQFQQLVTLKTGVYSAALGQEATSKGHAPGSPLRSNCCNCGAPLFVEDRKCSYCLSEVL